MPYARHFQGKRMTGQKRNRSRSSNMFKSPMERMLQKCCMEARFDMKAYRKLSERLMRAFFKKIKKERKINTFWHFNHSCQ